MIAIRVLFISTLIAGGWRHCAYFRGVKLAFYVLIAVLLSCLQYSVLASWPFAPDLPLALAAWAMVDGDDDGVLLRAWVVGLSCDFFDPGSGLGYGLGNGAGSIWNACFHTLTYSALGVGALVLRTFVFRSRSIGWAGWAFAASVVIQLIDARLGGVGLHWLVLFGSATLTALAAMAIGWLLGGLPEPYRPIGHGGA
ncbi:MAG: hypothetical protein H0V44_02205 [Planctomycetes bacterium]|nr:hypothetical protein [Planctomycetota bacterium]